MKKIVLVAIAITVQHFLSAQCNCKTLPWKPDPPCVDECLVQFFLNNNAGQIHRKLDIEKEDAKKIRLYYEQNPGNSLDPVKTIISEEFLEQLREKGKTLGNKTDTTSPQ